MNRPIGGRVTSSGGVTIQIYEFGGQGPPLLFCHATGFCGGVWEPLATALAGSFQCLALDFRAHGRSSAPHDHDMSWSGMADDILAAAAEVSPNEPIRAVGHSLGGGAIVLAETSKPGSIHSAWTFEPILFPKPPPTEHPKAPHQTPISMGARRRRRRFASRADVHDRYRSRPPLDQLDDRCLRAYIECGFRDRDDGTVELSCLPEHEARTFEQHRTGASERVAELTIPFALAVGGGDEPPAASVIDVAAANPHLELIRYPDLTHFGPLEAPDRIAADIARWFGR